MRRKSGFVGFALASVLVISLLFILSAGTCFADNWAVSADSGLEGNYGPTEDSITSMAMYGSVLYAGTADETFGCQIWAYIGSAWTKVRSGGFGDKYNIVAKSMCTDNSRLYVGTGKLGLGGGEVWAYDGSDWEQINTDGFGSAYNTGVSSMAVYGSKLYVGTDNSTTGGEVWRYNGGSWEKVASGGFGDANTRVVQSLCVYGSSLFAGTTNFFTGCEVWKYDGASWDRSVGQSPPGTIGTGRGFGGGSENQSITAMTVWNSKLYAGLTVSWDANVWAIPLLLPKDWAHKVWCFDGTSWTPVTTNGGYGGPNWGLGTLDDSTKAMGVYGTSLCVGSRNDAQGCQVWLFDGTAWALLNTSGFGSVGNKSASALAISGSNLYVGTTNELNGSEVWRYSEATWERISKAGFAPNNNYKVSPMADLNGWLYAGTASKGGAEVWRNNGSGWASVSTGGFENQYNLQASSMVTLNSNLYVGTKNNIEGGEVWRFDGSDWLQVNNPGFHPEPGQSLTVNDDVASMAVYNGTIYAGTNNLQLWNNLTPGCQVYTYSGANWTIDQASGFGDPNNLTATSMCTYGDGLYVGTSNQSTGCEVWKRGPGGWQQVNTDGFGSKTNGKATSMAIFDGSLYVGTSGNRSQVFKYIGGSQWTNVGSDGFGESANLGVASLVADGNTLYAGTTTNNGSPGGQVWRFNGTKWARAAVPGFGNPQNTVISSLAKFGSKIYAGTCNKSNGGEIWSSLGPSGSIQSVTQAYGSHGQTLNVPITGNGTHFVSGASKATFSGTGITVNSTTVFNETNASANISIDASAQPGTRDVNVITVQDTPTALMGGFTVLDPRITSVSPVSVFQGETREVSIKGTDTHFTSGAGKATFSGSGITVNSTTVIDDTNAKASITLSHGARAITRDVNLVTTGMTTEPLEKGLTVNVHPPLINTVTQAYGRVDDPVVIRGDWFGLRRESSVVTFNGKPAEEYLKWGSTEISCKVPAGATSGPLVVRTSAGSSNSASFKVVNTIPGANVKVAAGNGTTVEFNNVNSPGNTISSTVQGDPVIDGYSVAKGTTRNVTTTAGYNGKVTVTLSYAGVQLYRYQEENLVLLHEEGGGWVNVTTGRDSTNKTVAGQVNDLSRFVIAIPSDVSVPAGTTWYLPEGSTDWGFSTYISIENPNRRAVTARVTYYTSTGQVSRPNITLPPMSQTTLDPAGDLGNKDFSTKVECLEAEVIAVDRTTRWTGPGAASPEGHSSIGSTTPEKIWYLPEGSSNYGFETWLLVQNPNNKAAKCTLTYMIENEATVTLEKSVPANSRASFNMSRDIGNKDASIKVESDQPVVAERSMYRNNLREGSSSIGATQPDNDYYLAEGTTNWGFTTYVLVQNPNEEPCDVTLGFMTDSGYVPGPEVTMPATSRKTFTVNRILDRKDFSTKIHGSLPIIAERAMYWNNGTGEASHASIGEAGAHKTFYLPDGQTTIGWETWTLVQNPNPAPVEIEISYLTRTGAGNIVFTDTLPANYRRSYNMGSKIMNQRAAIMVKCKTTGKSIMVERSMYWNNKGAGTCTIGGYSD